MDINLRVLGIISCVDDNKDEMRIIESIASNTKVLNIRSSNTTFDNDSEITKFTEIVLDKKKASQLKNMLDKYINSEN